VHFYSDPTAAPSRAEMPQAAPEKALLIHADFHTVLATCNQEQHLHHIVMKQSLYIQAILLRQLSIRNVADIVGK